VSWIRLDDQIAHHPKVTRVSPGACWLWVTAIGFAQKFLTDGFIPTTSIRALSHVDNPEDFIAELLAARLLDQADGGYQVHDYLDFNASAASVKAKREADRVRKESARIPAGFQAESARNPQSVLARAPASHPIPSLPKNNNNEGPIFQGARFVVMPFMDTELRNLLADDAETFDLGSWYWALNEKFPKGGRALDTDWPWLKKQFRMEARNRGLMLGSQVEMDARTNGNGKRPPKMISAIGGTGCPHDPICQSNTKCIALCLEEGRRERAAQ